MYKLVFFFFLTFILWPGEFYAQTDSSATGLKFEEKQFDEWKKQKDFQYLERETRTNWWAEFKAWINYQYQQLVSWLFGEYEADGLLGWFISIFPYVLLLLVLFFLSWLFIRLNPVFAAPISSEGPKVFYSEEEKMLRTKDISALIDQAKSQQQYRLAVRYYYVQSLQKLNTAEFIKYHPEKTNTDYLTEIPSEKIKRAFTKTTRIYEHIWYGDFTIEKPAFLAAEKDFLNLENSLHQ